MIRLIRLNGFLDSRASRGSTATSDSIPSNSVRLIRKLPIVAVAR